MEYRAFCVKNLLLLLLLYAYAMFHGATTYTYHGFWVMSISFLLIGIFVMITQILIFLWEDKHER